MPYNSTGTWIEEPSTINRNSLTKYTIISKPINIPKVIPYNSDVCDNNQLNTALSYDIELFDLCSLLIKKNSSRTWYNKFRLDESGLIKRLNLFYTILSSRFSNFGISVANILQKYKLQPFQFNEYCYFQVLKNIYINIKMKYSTNVYPIFSSIDDSIVKVYLFFLVKYFNDYVSRYKDMLEKNNKKKAINIRHNNILLNKYNTTYNSIINKSIRQLNNRRLMIRENYEPYKLCITFYERFYNVYNSLLKFLYEKSYDIESNSNIYRNIQKLKNRIDKLHFVLVETVTGRIERNKQKKLEREILLAEQRKYYEKLPKSVPSWTSELSINESRKLGNISQEERNRRQREYEISRVIKLQEESNKQTINACSTPGITMIPEDCNQARARQAQRNRNKANAAIKFQDEYFRQHGHYPPDGPYSH